MFVLGMIIRFDLIIHLPKPFGSPVLPRTVNKTWHFQSCVQNKDPEASCPTLACRMWMSTGARWGTPPPVWNSAAGQQLGDNKQRSKAQDRKWKAINVQTRLQEQQGVTEMAVATGGSWSRRWHQGMLPHLGKISFTKHSDCFVLCQGRRMSGWEMGGRRLGVWAGGGTGRDRIRQDFLLLGFRSFLVRNWVFLNRPRQPEEHSLKTAQHFLLK